jgi:hypothetical protein
MICENARWVDVRCWERDGQLVPGHSFQCSWTLDGKPHGAMQVRTESTAVVFSFAVFIDDLHDWKAVEQRVPIVQTQCHLGGTRRWFSCTSVGSHGQTCGKRAAILYFGQDFAFACRRCSGLNYASQPP